jgi:hypothetical protein
MAGGRTIHSEREAGPALPAPRAVGRRALAAADAGETFCPPTARVSPATHFRPIDSEEPLATLDGAFQAAGHALTSWAMHAAAGRVCIYARVDRLGRGGVGERARQLHAQGIVKLLPQRRTDSGLFEYRAERTGMRFADGDRTVPDPLGLRPEPRLMLDLLVQLAGEGARCPHDKVLAAMLGYRRTEAVQRHFSELRRRGLVRWELTAVTVPGDLVRVVTIVASGAQTWSPRGAA